MNESLATILETIADLRADRLAISQGDRRLTWAELDNRAARLAAYLAGHGIGPGSRVAIALYNGPEYIESVFAVLKLRGVPVNVNYRYRSTEMREILAGSGARAVVLDESLKERFDAVRDDLPRLRTFLVVGAVGTYEEALGDPAPRIGRSGDDLWVTYTGGTTGSPKAVVTRHSWVYKVCTVNGFTLLGQPVPDTLEDLRAATRKVSGDQLVYLPAPPLMHATGMYTTLGGLVASGRIVYLAGKSYDPAEVARTIERERVDTMSIVGDVFARPLADELDAHPYDISSLKRIVSVGLAWSKEIKTRLLAHGDILCREMVAATEGGPFAFSEMTREKPAELRLAPGARVVDENNRDVEPGSGQTGIMAAPADNFVHYEGDPDRTELTFRRFDGQRWAMPGDLATVRADGTVHLLGRGSGVINTGGEKVHAEEVEQVVARHPAVREAVVVGAPDMQWGQVVVAIVQLQPDATLDLAALAAHVSDFLAAYKKPRRLLIVPEIRRSPAGKVDMRWIRDEIVTS
ncbi:acyl-CoA synthetase [Fodinicola feengrottensis]|uniref:Acyl-CoA synthetase n=1 Tax=Fodinicola feengrottensis TaxID=435914 RepID=A0ABP4TG47_9ACTN